MDEERSSITRVSVLFLPGPQSKRSSNCPVRTEMSLSDSAIAKTTHRKWHSCMESVMQIDEHREHVVFQDRDPWRQGFISSWFALLLAKENTLIFTRLHMCWWKRFSSQLQQGWFNSAQFKSTREKDTTRQWNKRRERESYLLDLDSFLTLHKLWIHMLRSFVTDKALPKQQLEWKMPTIALVQQTLLSGWIS